MSWSTRRLIKRLIVWLSAPDWFVCFNTDNTSNHLSLWSLHTLCCSAANADIWQPGEECVCVCVCAGWSSSGKMSRLVQQTHDDYKDKWRFSVAFVFPQNNQRANDKQRWEHSQRRCFLKVCLRLSPPYRLTYSYRRRRLLDYWLTDGGNRKLIPHNPVSQSCVYIGQESLPNR